MAELRISTFTNGFVLYFETPESRIDAYALASTLVSLADAAKAVGRSLNGAVDIQIVIEALNSGSFRARISAIARESGLFVKNQLVTGIVISALGNYIYDHTLSKRDPIQVEVNTEEVIITHGEDRVIVPREVHEATEMVAQNPVFVRSIDRMLGSVIKDERVTGFGLAADVNGPPPALMLPLEFLVIRVESSDPEANLTLKATLAAGVREVALNLRGYCRRWDRHAESRDAEGHARPVKSRQHYHYRQCVRADSRCGRGWCCQLPCDGGTRRLVSG